MKTTTKARWVFLAVIGTMLASPFGATARAALYSGYIGNRTDASGVLIDTAGGMSATGNAWAVTGTNLTNKGVRLDWTVDPSGDNWVYTYSFIMATTAQKDIKDFDLQVAGDFAASDLVSSAVTAPASGVTGPTAGATSPAAISENSGTIASPTVLTITKGYQWVCAGTTDYPTFTMTVTTTRAPVWGDFIVFSSATTATEYLTAYNTGFGAVKGTFPATGGVYNGQVAVPGPSLNKTLTVTFAGTGGGTVNSDPAGIACSGPSCDASFPSNQQVTLHANGDATSTFAGWSGDCSGASCTVTMDTARAVTATFTAAPHVMGGGVPYATIQNAFDNAADPIQTLAIPFTEVLVFNRPGLSLQFLGGYDAAYSTAGYGWTNVTGSLTISDGTLTVSGVAVQ